MTATAQNMQALAWANEVRMANARFRRQVMAMPPRLAAEFVADAVECDYDHKTLGALPIGRMLSFVPRVGPRNVSKCLRSSGVASESRPLRDLTPRQRQAVAANLRLWAAGYGHGR